MDIPPDSPKFKYTLVESYEPRYSKKYQRTESTLVFKISHNLDEFKDIFDAHVAVDNMYESIMSPILKKCDPSDSFAVAVNAEGLSHEVFVPSSRVDKFNKMDFLNTLSKVAQSNSSFLLNFDSLHL